MELEKEISYMNYMNMTTTMIRISFITFRFYKRQTNGNHFLLDFLYANSS